MRALLFVALVACRPAAAPAPSVEGTTWAFCDGDARVTFEPSGALAMGGSSARCTGRWRQSGAEVSFDCDALTTYDAAIEGDRMRGSWQRLPEETLRKGMPGLGNQLSVRADDRCADGTCSETPAHAVPIEGTACLRRLARSGS